MIARSPLDKPSEVAVDFYLQTGDHDKTESKVLPGRQIEGRVDYLDRCEVW